MLEVLKYIAYMALNDLNIVHTKDQSNVEGVKDTLYRFQCIKCYVCQRWCLWLLHNTVYRVMLLMSKVSRVSNTMYCALYTVASHPCQEGRLFESSILGV